MPKVRRRCALCDRALPDSWPVNTCSTCQQEEAGRAHEARRAYEDLRELEREVISHQVYAPGGRRGFAAIVPVTEQTGTQACPQCYRPIWNVTSICHPRNPIFDCPFGTRNESHRHHFCACGHEVITVTITLPQEAENGSSIERA